jgi:hypothetical protein
MRCEDGNGNTGETAVTVSLKVLHHYLSQNIMENHERSVNTELGICQRQVRHVTLSNLLTNESLIQLKYCHIFISIPSHWSTYYSLLAWLWNMVSYSAGRTWVSSIWKQSSKEDIWNQGRCIKCGMKDINNMELYVLYAPLLIVKE